MGTDVLGAPVFVAAGVHAAAGTPERRNGLLQLMPGGSEVSVMKLLLFFRHVGPGNPNLVTSCGQEEPLSAKPSH